MCYVLFENLVGSEESYLSIESLVQFFQHFHKNLLLAFNQSPASDMTLHWSILQYHLTTCQYYCMQDNNWGPDARLFDNMQAPLFVGFLSKYEFPLLV